MRKVAAAIALVLAGCASTLDETHRIVTADNAVRPAKPRPTGRTTEVPRPRPGDIAIREQYEAAMRENTKAAFERFIARYPDHPLAADAAKRLLAIAPD